jgi:hypothetical protein
MGEKLSEGEKWAIVGMFAGFIFAPFTGGASLLGSFASALGGAVAASQAEDK